MKLDTTSILLAACCWCTLTTPACSILQAHKAAPTPLANAPKPVERTGQPVEIAADLPISVPQTQVTLPRPQPVQDEALTVVKAEAPPAPQPNQTAKPPRAAAPKPEQRQQPVTAPTVPAGAEPPPAPPRRIRPVQSAAERQRLTAQIAASQRQVLDNLAKTKSRRLSDAEKSAVERIQSFLEQTDSALKEQDLQQAAALSNRALLLSQDLNSER
jgi:hypothetical protein